MVALARYASQFLFLLSKAMRINFSEEFFL
ncbi:MAG: hypothetical protein CDV28_101217 [Candidatus Electronema aureum]|uniref:Uncharacterized protein n=1 Tax=Candidatus Electronema aureum TaxID=2005002 RepID=A0A521G5L8_9BACT|nr:MAG: hypothetical protein CDV28_101217 [Candidatus Electronema aureum]